MTESRLSETTSLNPEVFQHYFPSGRIEKIELQDVPMHALTYFEQKSAQLINENEYRPGNFDQIMLVSHNDGSQTYIAHQTKTYSTNNDTESLIYLVDMNGKGENVGHGEVRKNISNTAPFFKDKPFVSYTFTEDDHTQRGLGRRRLLLMNALSQMMYGFPLNSDTVLIDKEKKLWERLVAENRAKQYQEGPNPRFVFT